MPMQIASQRGWNVGEHHDRRLVHTDSVRLELDTDSGVTVVEGAVLLDKPRLLQVDGIYCEAGLSGHVVFMKNQDVPGVIGHVGTVLGRNRINIANFSLGRRDEPLRPANLWKPSPWYPPMPPFPSPCSPNCCKTPP